MVWILGPGCTLCLWDVSRNSVNQITVARDGLDSLPADDWDQKAKILPHPLLPDSFFISWLSEDSILHVEDYTKGAYKESFTFSPQAAYATPLHFLDLPHVVKGNAYGQYNLAAIRKTERSWDPTSVVHFNVLTRRFGEVKFSSPQLGPPLYGTRPLCSLGKHFRRVHVWNNHLITSLFEGAGPEIVVVPELEAILATRRRDLRCIRQKQPDGSIRTIDSNGVIFLENTDPGKCRHAGGYSFTAERILGDDQYLVIVDNEHGYVVHRFGPPGDAKRSVDESEVVCLEDKPSGTNTS